MLSNTLLRCRFTVQMTYKQPLSALAQLTPSELQAGCQQSRPDNAHEPFCFELFRRAIVEKSETCWSAIYQQYKNLVYRWIIQFAKTDTLVGGVSIEEMVLDAFTAFWRAFTPDKLQNAGYLASILAYLKSCAATAVLQAQRKLDSFALETEWDEVLVESQKGAIQPTMRADELLLKQMYAERLWTVVERCCKDDKERVIARLCLVANLKPRQILEHYPTLFADIAEIYMLNRNLKNRLGRDKQLLELWGEYCHDRISH